MESIRERIEAAEARFHARAARAALSRGRARPEPQDEIRTAFQRDRDRVLHCKAFRRLKHKTQVFLAPKGDHYRTRITHTLEVMQLSRTLARALNLNEDLAEAIALGHDLGHTPFGHAGEAFLDKAMGGGFRHYQQSVRVVEVLENGGHGLNLTEEVRDGIAKHSKGEKGQIFRKDPSKRALTLEGDVVRVSDFIAYCSSDIDDAIRAGLITAAEIPPEIRAVLGDDYSGRLRNILLDVIHSTLDNGLTEIAGSARMESTLEHLRKFLFERVYYHPGVRGEFTKAEGVITRIWESVNGDPGKFLDPADVEKYGLNQAAVDFISGMTDVYAIDLYQQLVVPQRWSVM
jgi:dGTPase